jgi:hypothetical protein
MTEPSVFETALAYQETAALTAAVKLDVFSLIGAGSTTVDALVSATGASPRGLRILCDYLTVIGLLQKQGTNYDLTPAARRFLDRSSPLAMGDCVDFLAAPEMLALVLDDPVSYVRRGGAEGLSVIAPDHPVWIRFARAMAPFAALTAKRVAAYVATLPQSPLTVLDVAAGHGLYGIEVARAVPAALVTAVDWAGSSRLRGRMRRPPGWMIGSARSSAVHSTWNGRAGSISLCWQTFSTISIATHASPCYAAQNPASRPQGGYWASSSSRIRIAYRRRCRRHSPSSCSRPARAAMHIRSTTSTRSPVPRASVAQLLVRSRRRRRRL